MFMIYLELDFLKAEIWISVCSKECIDLINFS